MCSLDKCITFLAMQMRETTDMKHFPQNNHIIIITGGLICFFKFI